MDGRDGRGAPMENATPAAAAYALPVAVAAAAPAAPAHQHQHPAAAAPAYFPNAATVAATVAATNALAANAFAAAAGPAYYPPAAGPSYYPNATTVAADAFAAAAAGPARYPANFMGATSYYPAAATLDSADLWLRSQNARAFSYLPQLSQLLRGPTSETRGGDTMVAANALASARALAYVPQLSQLPQDLPQQSRLPQLSQNLAQLSQFPQGPTSYQLLPQLPQGPSSMTRVNGDGDGDDGTVIDLTTAMLVENEYLDDDEEGGYEEMEDPIDRAAREVATSLNKVHSESNYISSSSNNNVNNKRRHLASSNKQRRQRLQKESCRHLMKEGASRKSEDCAKLKQEMEVAEIEINQKDHENEPERVAVQSLNKPKEEMPQACGQDPVESAEKEADGLIGKIISNGAMEVQIEKKDQEKESTNGIVHSEEKPKEEAGRRPAPGPECVDQVEREAISNEKAEEIPLHLQIKDNSTHLDGELFSKNEDNDSLKQSRSSEVATLGGESDQLQALIEQSERETKTQFVEDRSNLAAVKGAPLARQCKTEGCVKYRIAKLKGHCTACYKRAYPNDDGGGDKEGTQKRVNCLEKEMDGPLDKVSNSPPDGTCAWDFESSPRAIPSRQHSESSAQESQAVAARSDHHDGGSASKSEGIGRSEQSHPSKDCKAGGESDQLLASIQPLESTTEVHSAEKCRSAAAVQQEQCKKGKKEEQEPPEKLIEEKKIIAERRKEDKVKECIELATVQDEHCKKKKGWKKELLKKLENEKVSEAEKTKDGKRSPLSQGSDASAAPFIGNAMDRIKQRHQEKESMGVSIQSERQSIKETLQRPACAQKRAHRVEKRVGLLGQILKKINSPNGSSTHRSESLPEATLDGPHSSNAHRVEDGRSSAAVKVAPLNRRCKLEGCTKYRIAKCKGYCTMCYRSIYPRDNSVVENDLTVSSEMVGGVTNVGDSHGNQSVAFVAAVVPTPNVPPQPVAVPTTVNRPNQSDAFVKLSDQLDVKSQVANTKGVGPQPQEMDCALTVPQSITTQTNQAKEKCDVDERDLSVVQQAEEQCTKKKSKKRDRLEKSEKKKKETVVNQSLSSPGPDVCAVQGSHDTISFTGNRIASGGAISGNKMARRMNAGFKKELEENALRKRTPTPAVTNPVDEERPDEKNPMSSRETKGGRWQDSESDSKTQAVNIGDGKPRPQDPTLQSRIAQTIEAKERYDEDCRNFTICAKNKREKQGVPGKLEKEMENRVFQRRNGSRSPLSQGSDVCVAPIGHAAKQLTGNAVNQLEIFSPASLVITGAKPGPHQGPIPQSMIAQTSEAKGVDEKEQGAGNKKEPEKEKEERAWKGKDASQSLLQPGPNVCAVQVSHDTLSFTGNAIHQVEIFASASICAILDNKMMRRKSVGSRKKPGEHVLKEEKTAPTAKDVPEAANENLPSTTKRQGQQDSESEEAIEKQSDMFGNNQCQRQQDSGSDEAATFVNSTGQSCFKIQDVDIVCANLRPQELDCNLVQTISVNEKQSDVKDPISSRKTRRRVGNGGRGEVSFAVDVPNALGDTVENDGKDSDEYRCRTARNDGNNDRSRGRKDDHRYGEKESRTRKEQEKKRTQTRKEEEKRQHERNSQSERPLKPDDSECNGKEGRRSPGCLDGDPIHKDHNTANEQFEDTESGKSVAVVNLIDQFVVKTQVGHIEGAKPQSQDPIPQSIIAQTNEVKETNVEDRGNSAMGQQDQCAKNEREEQKVTEKLLGKEREFGAFQRKHGHRSPLSLGFIECAAPVGHSEMGLSGNAVNQLEIFTSASAGGNFGKKMTRRKSTGFDTESGMNASKGKAPKSTAKKQVQSVNEKQREVKNLEKNCQMRNDSKSGEAAIVNQNHQSDLKTQEANKGANPRSQESDCNFLIPQSIIDQTNEAKGKSTEERQSTAMDQQGHCRENKREKLLLGKLEKEKGVQKRKDGSRSPLSQGSDVCSQASDVTTQLTGNAIHQLEIFASVSIGAVLGIKKRRRKRITRYKEVEENDLQKEIPTPAAENQIESVNEEQPTVENPISSRKTKRRRWQDLEYDEAFGLSRQITPRFTTIEGGSMQSMSPSLEALVRVKGQKMQTTKVSVKWLLAPTKTNNKYQKPSMGSVDNQVSSREKKELKMEPVSKKLAVRPSRRMSRRLSNTKGETTEFSEDEVHDNTEQTFNVNEVIFAWDKGHLYEAKVLKCRKNMNGRYLVHYLGYHKSHDKWVTSHDMLKDTASSRKFYGECKTWPLEDVGVENARR